MTTDPNPPQELVAKIRAAERVLITSHVNPDGDAVGSSLGLARVLRRLGKSATVWLRDTPPAAFSELRGASRIHTGESPPNGFPDEYNLAVTLECPSIDRCGLETPLEALPVLNIDHHLGNEHYGVVNWVDPSAPAVGELVLRLADKLHAEVDPDTATCLFLALATDTGWFRFANATPDAFKTAAVLVGRGAKPEQVSEWLYEQQSPAALRLLSEMLPTLEIAGDGAVATTVLTQEMFDNAGAEQQHTEGLIDHARSIAGVQTVALLREREPGVFKVSLRSRGEIDVQSVALKYGGGGHKNAAGFAVEMPAAEARALVVRELSALLS